MKKAELQKLIESAIREGVMDNLTTQLSRQIVNHLRQHGDTQGKSFIQSFHTTIGDLQVLAKFTPVGSAYKLDAGNARLSTPFPGDKYAELWVTIQVPQPFRPQELEAFIPKLKSLLRHELEHDRQNQRSIDKTGKVNGTHRVPFGAIVGPYPDMRRDGMSGDFPAFDDPEMVRRYYLHPQEIEAYVMGAYKEAKAKKIPFTDVLTQELTNIANMLIQRNMNRRVIKSIIDDIREAWTGYALSRLPKNAKTGLQYGQDVVDSTGEIAAESRKVR